MFFYFWCGVSSFNCVFRIWIVGIGRVLWKGKCWNSLVVICWIFWCMFMIGCYLFDFKFWFWLSVEKEYILLCFCCVCLDVENYMLGRVYFVYFWLFMLWLCLKVFVWVFVCYRWCMVCNSFRYLYDFCLYVIYLFEYCRVVGRVNLEGKYIWLIGDDVVC